MKVPPLGKGNIMQNTNLSEIDHDSLYRELDELLEKAISRTPQETRRMEQIEHELSRRPWDPELGVSSWRRGE
jgi:hypothetical protein